MRDTVDKKKEYRGAGVNEYYILDARGLKTAFYRLDDKGKYQEISPVGKDVIESRALPGFRFRISDLYDRTSFEQMADDDLYNSFVLPFHQKVKRIAAQERQRAESEKMKAEQECRRAEQAEQRAALLADKLKQLGISVE